MNTTSLHFDNRLGISKQTKEDFKQFESLYLSVREKENRVLSIEDIRKLPEVSSNYQHRNEWQIRKNSILKLEKILEKQELKNVVLDIGCGNGFFTNRLSKFAEKVIGLDINLFELRQASEAFLLNTKTHWLCADVFDKTIFDKPEFDLITFCSSFQYFPNTIATINHCLQLLSPKGKILIIDTAFYQDHEIESARKRSLDYYQKIGVPELAQYYHHHRLSDLNNFLFQDLFKQSTLSRLINKKSISPFPCIEISKR